MRFQYKKIQYIFLFTILIIFSNLFIFEKKIKNFEYTLLDETENSYQHIPEIKLNNVEEIFFNYSKTTQRRFFFPLTHEQVFLPWDTGLFGYSSFNIILQNYNLEVSTITDSLADRVMNMTSNDIIYLNVAKFAKYTSYEINNLTSFVERGGKLIIVGEHFVFNFSDFQNDLLKYFDMQITDLDVTDDIHNSFNDPAWNVFNSSFFGLTNISIMFGSVVNITGSNAFAIANTSYTANHPNQPIMAGFIHPNMKGGKVFVCSDSEWIWNTNTSVPGMFYGNNSKLVLKLLDWFYDINYSIEIENGLNILPEFNLFSSPKFSNFTLNITLNNELNVSAIIEGGSIFPNSGINLSGPTSWEINVSSDGYVKFIYTKNENNMNISKIIFFFESNSPEKVLFLENNYSRSVNPSLDGLLKFAIDMKDHNFSVFASSVVLNYSDFNCLIIANPLEFFSDELETLINESSNNGTKIIFLNVPYSSLDAEDTFLYMFKYKGFKSLIPINNISDSYGIFFDRYLVGDSDNNIGDKLYFPKIIGADSTFYNLSCYFAAVVNVTDDYYEELEGYSTSWGEYRTIFGTSELMGEHAYDGNNTCVLAYTNKTMGAGILNYFTNQYYDTSKYFNDYFFNWIRTGEFNKKYTLEINRTDTDFYYKDINFKVYSTEKIKDLNGEVVPNGTIFNVEITLGQILTLDAEPGIPGFQIKAYNGSVNLTCTSGSDIGLCEIAIYNTTNFKVILSILLNFSSKPTLFNISPDPSPNGNFTLRWKTSPTIKTYYLFKSNNFIENVTGLNCFTNVSTDNYNETLTTFGVYYYVIIGSDYQKNTSISNCISIDIHPVLNLITPNPNNDGNIVLNWNSLIAAKTYYIFKYYAEITEETITDINVKLLGNVSTNNFIDSSEFVQANTYYYAIVGSDYSRNSSLSNCVSVLINLIPHPPKFSSNYFIFTQRDIFFSWSNEYYANSYKVYLSSENGFIPSESNLFSTAYSNYVMIENLGDGIYYLRIKSIGFYGNSTYSEQITIEMKTFVYITPDNPWLLFILILSFLAISTIVIFSYFWYYIKNKQRIQEISKNREIKKKQ